MAAISFSGLASGIDSSALIKTLLDQQRSARIKPLQNKVSDLTDTSDKLKELKGLALKLSSAIDGFRTLSGGVVARKVSSSDEGIVSASASNTAAAGSYSLTVNQLAKNATASFSDRYSASTSAINSAINAGASAVDRTVSVTIGNGAEQEIVNVELTSTTTLDQFVTEFNESSTKATAAIVNVGTSASPSYAISFTTSNSGLDKGQVAINVGAEITSAGAGALSATTVSQALDANFSISGISGSITRSTNTVSDVLAGISLNLQTTAIYASYSPKILSPELNSSNKVELRQSILQRQIKSNLNYQLENQKIEFGVNATHYKLNPGELLPGTSPSVNYQRTPAEAGLELAIHADDEISLTPDLAVSAGLRYSRFLNLGPTLVRRYASGESLDETSVVDSVRYANGKVFN